MSQEIEVSPYEKNIKDSAACKIAIGIAVGAVQFAKESLTMNEQEKESLKKCKENKRKERACLKQLERTELKRVPLKLTTSDTLITSATHLGFRVEAANLPTVTHNCLKALTLTKPSGQSLTITRGTTGRLILETSGNTSTIETLVQRHTVDQALNHLKKECTSVQIKKHRDGSYVIQGKEKNQSQKDGIAQIKTHVSNNGIATVDISGVKGKRCDKIVKGITKAIGGECVKSRKKSEYYQIPVEEKEKVRV